MLYELWVTQGQEPAGGSCELIFGSLEEAIEYVDSHYSEASFGIKLPDGTWHKWPDPKDISLKDHVKGPVHFQYYRDQELWYRTHKGLLFPVPLSDDGTATFNRDDKGIFFMRWIRKYLEELNKE